MNKDNDHILPIIAAVAFVMGGVSESMNLAMAKLAWGLLLNVLIIKIVLGKIF